MPGQAQGTVQQLVVCCVDGAALQPHAGHFDVLWPWPASVAREVATQQVRGGLPVPGFDARQREAAHAKIVDFHRQHLQPLP